MLKAEILYGETYRGWSGGERYVDSVNNGVVCYRITKRAGTAFARAQGTEQVCSLAAFAAWAKERVVP